MIVAERIYLRPVNAKDEHIIFQWENKPELWQVSSQSGPYSLDDIRNFISDLKDLFSSGQTRFMICERKSHEPIGSIDLFDFDSTRKSAGVGILIADEKNRGRGLAKEALLSFVAFCKERLHFTSLHCMIYPDNIPSIRVFEAAGFSPFGVTYFNHKKAVKYQRIFAV
jgi:diamine N-acetyltransferase